MSSSTAAVVKCVTIDSIGFGPSANAVSGRSIKKNTERPIRDCRLRSLPRATMIATIVLMIAKTYEISARFSYLPVNHAGPPGYTPSKKPSTTKSSDANSMSSTTVRSAPAAERPPFRAAECYSLGPFPLRLQPLDGLRWDEHTAEVDTVVAAPMEVTAARLNQIVLPSD